MQQQIAEKQYTLAAAALERARVNALPFARSRRHMRAAALERARVNAEGKNVYLATFVSPVLPRTSTYPKRFLFSLLGIAAAALLYAIGIATRGRRSASSRRDGAQ